MKSTRKLRLRMSSSNVKNFPKDFFDNDITDVNVSKETIWINNKRSDVAKSERKLPPVKLDSKLMRMGAPKKSQMKSIKLNYENIKNYLSTIPYESQRMTKKMKRRIFNKSLWLQRNMDNKQLNKIHNLSIDKVSLRNSPTKNLHPFENSLKKSLEVMIHRRHRSGDNSFINRSNIEHQKSSRQK